MKIFWISLLVVCCATDETVRKIRSGLHHWPSWLSLDKENGLERMENPSAQQVRDKVAEYFNDLSPVIHRSYQRDYDRCIQDVVKVCEDRSLSDFKLLDSHADRTLIRKTADCERSTKRQLFTGECQLAWQLEKDAVSDEQLPTGGRASTSKYPDFRSDRFSTPRYPDIPSASGYSDTSRYSDRFTTPGYGSATRYSDRFTTPGYGSATRYSNRFTTPGYGSATRYSDRFTTPGYEGATRYSGRFTTPGYESASRYSDRFTTPGYGSATRYSDRFTTPGYEGSTRYSGRFTTPGYESASRYSDRFTTPGYGSATRYSDRFTTPGYEGSTRFSDRFTTQGYEGVTRYSDRFTTPSPRDTPSHRDRFTTPSADDDTIIALKTEDDIPSEKETPRHEMSTPSTRYGMGAATRYGDTLSTAAPGYQSRYSASRYPDSRTSKKYDMPSWMTSSNIRTIENMRNPKAKDIRDRLVNYYQELGVANHSNVENQYLGCISDEFVRGCGNSALKGLRFLARNQDRSMIGKAIDCERASSSGSIFTGECKKMWELERDAYLENSIVAAN